MPYNSMSGPADWAALQSSQKNDNFQNLIQMFASLMKWKQDRETQQGQFGQELGWQKEKFAQEKPMEERRVRAYEQAVQPKTPVNNPSDFEIRLQMGRAMGLEGIELRDYALARQPVKPDKTLDRLASEADITEKAKAKYRTPPKPDKPPKPTQFETPQYQQQKFVDSTIADVEKEIEALRKTAGVSKNPEKSPATISAGNLIAALGTLNSIRGKLMEGPLDPADLQLIKTIASKREDIKSMGTFWEPRFPSQQKTGMENLPPEVVAAAKARPDLDINVILQEYRKKGTRGTKK